MLCQEVSMCCFSTTKIFNYCLMQQTIIITHCRGAGQQNEQQQTKYLSSMFGHQQLLTGTETLEHSFNQELWVSVKVGIWNNSGYTRIGIINVQHILQCPQTILTMSSMSIVRINYCRYQSSPISKLIIQCCQQT